jgi:hypothetical protein
VSRSGDVSATFCLTTKCSLRTHAEYICRVQVRKHFYADAVTAMQAALGAGQSRIRLRCIIPELNVETDGGRCGPTLRYHSDE